MSLDIWRHELRRTGWQALVGPPLGLLAVALLAFLTEHFGNAKQVDRVLSASLDLLPLVAGLATAGVIVGDDVLELQLSLPVPFRATILRRVALELAWMAGLALTVTIALAASGRLVWPLGLPADQLIWLAPLLWLAGLAAAVTLGLRAAAASSALIGALWVAEQSFSDFFAGTPWLQAIWLFLRPTANAPTSWLWNRAILVGLTLVLGGLAIRWLGQGERLLGGES